MKKIYKDLEGRFELVNPWSNCFSLEMEKISFKLPWSNCIESHQTHLKMACTSPTHLIRNISIRKKNTENIKGNGGTLFICIVENHLAHPIA
jgi:hypothetical protein